MTVPLRERYSAGPPCLPTIRAPGANLSLLFPGTLNWAAVLICRAAPAKMLERSTSLEPFDFGLCSAQDKRYINAP